MHAAPTSLLIALLLVLFVVTPLFLQEFLCLEGFIGNMVYYGLFSALFAVSSLVKAKRVRRVGLEAWTILQLIWISILPLGMLANSMGHGGLSFFLSQRIAQYVYQESIALVLLVLSSALYARGKGPPTPVAWANLISPLTIAIAVRWLWIAIFESRQLTHFAETAPQLRGEYVVLASIPLLLAILILTLRKAAAGYVLGFLFGLVHIVLALLGVALGLSLGLGPVIVILSSLAMCIFSARGAVECRKKEPSPRRLVQEEQPCQTQS
jgi:hypothetical protein